MRITLDESTVTPAERARKSHSLALRRISEIGQNTIAAEIGVSPPTISRFVADDLERACQILAIAGLKLVPADRLVIRQHIFESMATLVYGVLGDREMMRKLVREE